MGKIGQVIVVIIAISALYLMMLVLMPILTDFASTANTSLHATSNMELYPGTAEGVVAAPWILWFVPAVLGIVIVVIILKQPTQ